MKNLTKWLAFGAVLAAPATLACATPLVPGTTVAASPISVVNDGIVTSITGTLNAGTFSGNYAEYVILDGSNPFNGMCGATDCLTFVLVVSDTAGSPNGIEHVSVGDGGPPFGSLGPGEGFENYSLNVGYIGAAGDMGTDVPLTIDESLYGTVEFNFTGADAVAPGTGTEYLIIQTSASSYTAGNFGAIDSSTDTVAGFVPAAPTPEPNSLLLLGSGLLTSAGYVFKRRREASIL